MDIKHLLGKVEMDTWGYWYCTCNCFWIVVEKSAPREYKKLIFSCCVPPKHSAASQSTQLTYTTLYKRHRNRCSSRRNRCSKGQNTAAGISSITVPIQDL